MTEEMKQQLNPEEEDYGFSGLLASMKKANFPQPEIDRVTAAFLFAKEAHKGQRRRSGEQSEDDGGRAHLHTARRARIYSGVVPQQPPT